MRRLTKQLRNRCVPLRAFLIECFSGCSCQSRSSAKVDHPSRPPHPDAPASAGLEGGLPLTRDPWSPPSRPLRGTSG
ncbi:putative bacteriocin precursor [Methylobacterium sp. W2]|uniref:CLI_3235 family bacteriocin precursor n=1 Tax=Methylobacterium sp. W2 TaxID=2598107 RepID=UPI001D0C75A5|nr:putative bacteriocin precursor [Methylobacterium sp. W2]